MNEGLSNPVVEDDALHPPTFDVLPLSPETRSCLERMGYEHPTPVQRAVFEPATAGRDLVVQARTGTGKTAAFGLPIVEYAVRRSIKAPQVLCLCPTRELALQVTHELKELGSGRQIEPVAIYGGSPMGKQIDALAAGAQVVVGTPGRVLDHIRRQTLDTTHVRLLVLDEADEMLSMGFERELRAILETLPKERQTLLFSATLPPDIERLARERLREPEFLTLSGDEIGALSITHLIYLVTREKLKVLQEVIEIEDPESAIVFCNTKAETENVTQALQRFGFDADLLNGDLPQHEREQVMGRTQRGELRFLVATDVAARGIDVSLLTHVINYDFPENTEGYIHRTGRTGRAGRTGTAISLICPQDIGNLYLLRLTYKIRPFEKQLPTSRDLKTRREMDVVRMIVDSYAGRKAHPEDLHLARRLLTMDNCDEIIAHLLRDRLGERAIAEENAAAVRRARLPAPTINTKAHDKKRPEKAKSAPVPTERADGAASLEDGDTEDDLVLDLPVNHRHSEAKARPKANAEPKREAKSKAPSPAVATIATTTATSAEPAPEPRRPRRSRSRQRPQSDENFGEFGYSVSEIQIVEGRESKQSDPASEEKSPKSNADPKELMNWSPPEEEGDDDPILIGGAESSIPPSPRVPEFPLSEAELEMVSADSTPPPEAGQEYVDLFVDVGRADGAKAADFQKALRERGQISRRETGRIRVREHHAFIAVRLDVIDRALVALNGAEIAGKEAKAELARKRTAEND
jgi:ATP-dependent RNA helicase DeaD